MVRATGSIAITLNLPSKVSSLRGALQALHDAGRAYHVVIHTVAEELNGKVLFWPNRKSSPKHVSTTELDLVLPRAFIVYKIHGAVDPFDASRDQYVITEDDYVDFMGRLTTNSAIPPIFTEHFDESHFLFLGYGLGDWHLRVVLSGIARRARWRDNIASWAIQRDVSDLEKHLWEKRGVTLFDLPLEAFARKLRGAQDEG
ncbi:MAG: SIR2 family protein [Chloroflexi bacterium]|nr:SIR2 family protein [Chloroflexota bacterium]